MFERHLQVGPRSLLDGRHVRHVQRFPFLVQLHGERGIFHLVLGMLSQHFDYPLQTRARVVHVQILGGRHAARDAILLALRLVRVRVYTVGVVEHRVIIQQRATAGGHFERFGHARRGYHGVCRRHRRYDILYYALDQTVVDSVNA